MRRVLLVAICCLTIGHSIAQDTGKIPERIRELQGDDTRIKLTDGSTVEGRILRVEGNSFTVRQKDTGREVSIPFTRVSEVKKKGISKALLIPALIAGGALVVLCVAPYPLGFLCRQDPS